MHQRRDNDLGRCRQLTKNSAFGLLRAAYWCGCGNAAAHGELLSCIQSYKKIPTVVGLDAESENVRKIRKDLLNVIWARQRATALDDGGYGRDGTLANLFAGLR